MPSLAPVIKQPAERRPVRFEFGRPGGADIATTIASGVTAAGRVPAVTPLSIAAVATGLTYSLLTLEGGTVGELYSVRAVVQDLAGNQFELDQEVLVLDLAFREAGTVASAYLSIEKFVARVGVDESVRLSDDKGTGVIDAARLSAALTDAEAIINSYLAARYQVPLAPPVPDPVPTLTFDLALARLYGEALPDAVANRRDAAVGFLKDLAAGKAALPGSAAPVAASPTPVLVQPAERVFTRGSMRGF